MSSPLAVTAPIPFEGILYDVRFRRTGRMGDPLDSIAYRDGLPAASAGVMVCDGIAGPGFAEAPLTKSIKRNEKADEILVKGPDAKSRISEMSPYRPQLGRRTVIEGISSVAFLVMGDAGAVEQALADVPAIGGLRMRGFGEVRAWTVSETGCDDADGFAWHAEGFLLRRLPREIVERKMGGLPENAYVDFCRPEPPLTEESGRMEIAAPLLSSMIVNRQEAQRVGVGGYA